MVELFDNFEEKKKNEVNKTGIDLNDNFDSNNIPMTEKQSMMNMELDSFALYITRNLDSYLEPTICVPVVYNHYIKSIKKYKNIYVYGKRIFYEKIHKYCRTERKRLPERKSPGKCYVLKPEYVEMFKNLSDRVDEQSNVNEQSEIAH